MEVAPVAVRGSRVALARDSYRDIEDVDRPLSSAGGLVRNSVLFDPDNINGAIRELTARWITSGEIAHPEVIEAERRLVEAANRHDWDALAEIGFGAAYVSHRPLAAGGSSPIADQMSSMRMMASLVPDLWVEPAEILTHSAFGLITQWVVKGTSTEGVAIALPLVILILLDGDRVTRVEDFDAAQPDVALARFDELSVKDQPK